MTNAIVLGGSGAIGQSIAEDFQRLGWQTQAVGRAVCDLTSPSAIRSFAEQQQDVDVLVHCAGLNHPKRVDELTLQELRESFEANVLGFSDLLLQLRSKIRHPARIVVVSSLYGTFGRTGRMPYVMSKHALEGLVKSLAIEWGRCGTLVNAVAPGFIETPMTSKNNSADKIAELVRGVPLGRLGTPSEVAKLVSFLASPNNTYLTGQVVTIDGGFSCGGFQQ